MKDKERKRFAKQIFFIITTCIFAIIVIVYVLILRSLTYKLYHIHTRLGLDFTIYANNHGQNISYENRYKVSDRLSNDILEQYYKDQDILFIDEYNHNN